MSLLTIATNIMMKKVGMSQLGTIDWERSLSGLWSWFVIPNEREQGRARREKRGEKEIY
jgi:hypothetical protein